MPLHLAVPVRFFHFVPAKSFEAKPSLRSSFMSGRLYCLASTGVEQVVELCHVGLGHLRLHPAVRQIREACVADHVARLACDHEAAGVLLWCVPPSRSRKTLALWLPSSRSSGPLSEAWKSAACSSPPSSSSRGDRPRSRRCHGERVGREELRRGDRTRARHVAADHAARRHSAACGREGARSPAGPRRPPR